MIEFIIGPLYIWLQQLTNLYLTHCHLHRLDTLSPIEILDSPML
jgi:cAMP phosphodiesterase